MTLASSPDDQSTGDPVFAALYPGYLLDEDGILAGFMQDRMNARLMAAASTGNGRR